MSKYFKKYLIVISAVIVLLLSGCSSATINKELSREEAWKEDIEYLAEKLPQKHKNLFFKKTKKAFEEELSYLKENINNLTDEEIKVGMRQIIASIGDAHTSVRYDINDMFPLKFYEFKDGIYVIDASKEYEDIVYKRIVKVNNLYIEDVLEKLAAIIPHENEAQLKLDAPFFLQCPEILYSLKIIPEKSSMELTLSDEDGELSNKSITAVKYKEDRKRYDLAINYDDEEKIPLYLKNEEKNYWYEYLKDSKTVYINYNRCRNMKDQRFREFSKEVFDVIDNNEVDKVVIDLRQNGGGSSPIFNPMIEGIMKREKINKKDSLFVIVGRRTFSSAILNAVDLKNNTNSVFLGEPTGGKPNHYGEVRGLKLPNNKIIVSYSTKYFTYSKEDTPSFIPDKIIELTMEDFKNGRDPVLDEILKKQ